MRKRCLLCCILLAVLSMTACQRPSPDVPAAQTTRKVSPQPTEPAIVGWRAADEPVMNTFASSTYSGDRATHDAQNLLDDDGKTNWTEGVEGDGIGEYVQFLFRDTYRLDSIILRPGNQYDKNRYIDNSRPENITVTFSDGTAVAATLKDLMESQILVLEEPVMTSSVTITIDSVYHGYKYEDTVISDVMFDAYEPVYG